MKQQSKTTVTSHML